MKTNLKNWRTTSTRVACLFLTMSLVFVPVLTTPLPTPLIVTFGDSNAVHTAENTLDARVSAISIEYTNPLKALYVIRARTLIIIGHGGTGDTSTNNLVTWNAVKPLVQGTPAMHNYILACHSTRIAEKLRGMGRHATGFKGPIDAEIAALATVLSITKRTGAKKLYQETLMTTLNKALNKLLGREDTSLLYSTKGKVYKSWGAPYRWQIWWNFPSEYEADQFIWDLKQCLGAAGLANIAADALIAYAVAQGALAGPVGLLVGAIVAAMAFHLQRLISEFESAQDHSSGRLRFFLDIWATVSVWKTVWQDWDEVKTPVQIPLYEIELSSFGVLQTYASALPSSWKYLGYYGGSSGGGSSGGGGSGNYIMCVR